MNSTSAARCALLAVFFLVRSPAAPRGPPQGCFERSLFAAVRTASHLQHPAASDLKKNAKILRRWPQKPRQLGGSCSRRCLVFWATWRALIVRAHVAGFEAAASRAPAAAARPLPPAAAARRSALCLLPRRLLAELPLLQAGHRWGAPGQLCM